MRLLRQIEITVFQHFEGAWDETGTWVEGAETTRIIRGSVQPYKNGNEQLPTVQGLDYKSMFKVYTPDPVIPTEPLRGTTGTEMEILGERYETISVENWVSPRNERHFVAIVALKESGNGERL